MKKKRACKLGRHFSANHLYWKVVLAGISVILPGNIAGQDWEFEQKNQEYQRINEWVQEKELEQRREEERLRQWRIDEELQERRRIERRLQEERIQRRREDDRRYYNR